MSARRAVIALASLCGIGVAAAAKAADAPLPELYLLGAKYRQEVVSAFVLPGEPVPLQVLADGFRLQHEGRPIAPDKPGHWSWHPPTEPGLYRLRLENAQGETRVELNVFVMVPRSRVRNGRLNGYRIGHYPDKPLGGKAVYEPPRGFVEVTKENDDARVSPHFRLKQFLCKQESDYPKYVVLNDRLLARLERLLAAVNARGHECDTLHVMSGYRTPFYNALIENVKFSQHVFGGAADVFVDADGNELMDDLDRDGVLSKEDARVLASIADAIDRRPGAELLGGIGVYGGTKAHGPFVHIDARGWIARWGQ
jgi:hypothetical protein